MAVDRHVGAVNQTWVPLRATRAVTLVDHLSSPSGCILLGFVLAMERGKYCMFL